MYDAINENPDAPNITWPDESEDKAIIEFHACEFSIKIKIQAINHVTKTPKKDFNPVMHLTEKASFER